MTVEPLNPHLAEVGDIVEVSEAVLVFAGERAGLAGRREGRGFGGELLVEVAHVLLAADGGNEGRGQLPLQQGLPVHTLQRQEATTGEKRGENTETSDASVKTGVKAESCNRPCIIAPE